MIRLFPKSYYSAKLFEYMEEMLKEGIVSTSSSIVDEMEEVLSSYYGTQVLLTNSGTSSLHLTAKFGKKGVLIPSFGFIAVLNAFLYENLSVYLYDVDKNLQPDWNQVEEFINEGKVDILVIIHQFGIVVDVPDPIREKCEKNGIVIVEDASESIFSKGKKEAGKIGDISVLSFNGNKVISAGGGGAIVFNKSEYREKIYKMVIPKYAKNNGVYANITYNYRMTGIHAVFLKDQWLNKDMLIDEKKKVAQFYKRYDIKRPSSSDSTVFWLYPVYVNDKSRTIENFKRNQIGYQEFFKPYSMMKYANVSYKSIEKTKKIVDKGILLPIHREMSEEDVEQIINSIE